MAANHIEIIDHDTVREIRLNRPPVNALNLELVRGLIEAINKAGEEASAIVLSGRPGMFSAGLDVPQLMQLDRPAMAEFCQSFFGLMETVARSPIPIASAITGHCPAGGTVIVIFSDYRVMCRGRYTVGLNEVQVGLPIPRVIQHAMTRLTGPRIGEHLMVAGQLLQAEGAMAYGVVDAIVDEPAEAVEHALAWGQKLAALPQRAMRATRAIARADVAGLFDGFGEKDIDGFVDAWFTEETQATLSKLLKSLGK